MQMKNFLILVPVFLASAACCQTVTPTVLSNNGGFTQTSSGSIAWTIGEPVSELYQKPGHITTMGFHQTDLDVIAFLNDHPADADGIVVFPNPVLDLLNIKLGGLSSGRYALRLHD